jgi:hypothetical protein
MRFVSGHLITSLSAILIFGPLKLISSQPAVLSPVASSSGHFANEREKLLPLFVGTFKVIGCQPDSGKPYDGSVVVIRKGLELFVQESINGRTRTGTGSIMFEPETPTLEVEFSDSGILVGYELGSSGDTRQPRAGGWVDPRGNNRVDRKRLGMEVWYNHQPAPSPAFEQTKLQRASLSPIPADLLGFYQGDYRVIGEETGTGRLYTGRIQAKREGERLTIEGWVDGQHSKGEFVSERLSAKHPVILIKCRIGHQSLLSLVNVQTVGDNYPRICGYFYPVGDTGVIITTAKPRLETWFFDWR